MEGFETRGRQFIHFLGKQGRYFHIAGGIASAVCIATFNYFAPNEVICSVLYFIPITIVTWFANRLSGKLIAAICGFLWTIDNSRRWSLTVTAWNSLSFLAAFWLVALLVAKIKDMLDMERELSRKDPLTGVMNLRAFSEMAEYEIRRLSRQMDPFTLAFIDLDNFKMVNDMFGHRRGDELLQAIVGCLTANLRRTDIIARAGGDEFIIFLPGTGQDAARTVVRKIRTMLHDLSARNEWPTTLSMGVMTCVEGSCVLEDLIGAADRLMYDVKNSGRNDVRYETFRGEIIDSSYRE